MWQSETKNHYILGKLTCFQMMLSQDDVYSGRLLANKSQRSAIRCWVPCWELRAPPHRFSDTVYGPASCQHTSSLENGGLRNHLASFLIKGNEIKGKSLLSRSSWSEWPTDWHPSEVEYCSHLVLGAELPCKTGVWKCTGMWDNDIFFRYIHPS